MAGWATVQTGTQQGGTTTVPLTCAASAAHNTLHAVVEVNNPAAVVTPPAATGWKQAGPPGVCAQGQIGHWYWPDCPAGVVAASFGVGTGNYGRGHISEHTPPSGTTAVVLDTRSKPAYSNTPGGGTTMTVTPAAVNAENCLGLLAAANYFSVALPAGYFFTAPTGWAQLNNLHNGATACWVSFGKNDLVKGAAAVTTGQPVTGADLATELAWCASMVTLRAVAFKWIGAEGGGQIHSLALGPSGTMLGAWGDLSGPFRSADLGDSWQPSYRGLVTPDQQSSGACVVWSVLPGEATGTMYAVVGRDSGLGSLVASTDGGYSWAQRSVTALEVRGYTTPSPPRPAGNSSAEDRTTGNHLLAQDASSGANGHLYFASYGQGLMHSADLGVTWAAKGLAGVYLRAVVLNPLNPAEAWAGAWDDGGNGGVWHTTNLTAATPAWAKLPGYAGTVADLVVVGAATTQALYAACGANGLRYASVRSAGPLVPLNTADVDLAASLWVSVDGYDDGGSGHRVIAACSGGQPAGGAFTQVVRLTVQISAGMVGASMWKGAYAVATDWDTYPQWQTFVGTTTYSPGAPNLGSLGGWDPVVRRYYTEGVIAKDAANDGQKLADCKAHGVRKVCLTYRPWRCNGNSYAGNVSVTGAPAGLTYAQHKADIQASVAYAISVYGKDSLEFTLWHECNGYGQTGPFGDGTGDKFTNVYTGVTSEADARANWLAYCAFYEDCFTANGVTLTYVPGLFSPGTSTTWYPPANGRSAAVWPDIAVDIYCTNYWGPWHTTLPGTMADLQTAVDAHGGRFGCWEFGWYNSTPQEIIDFLAWMQGIYAARPAAGKRNGDIMWFAIGLGDVPTATRTAGEIDALKAFFNAVSVSTQVTSAYADLTGAAAITTATLPDGRAWWAAADPAQDWLGAGGQVNPSVLINPGNHAQMWVANSAGVFRTDNTGATWKLCVVGMPQADLHTFHPCPLDDTHVYAAGQQYPALDLTDITGADPSKVLFADVPHDAGTSAEAHTISADPVTGDWVEGINTAPGANSGGQVIVHAHGDPLATWTTLTGYRAAVGEPGAAPMGVFAGRDAASKRYIIAVAQGKGVYRAASTTTDPPTWPAAWAAVRTGTGAPGTAGTVRQQAPIVAGVTAGHLRLFDRKTGLWYSTDYGATWALAWAKVTSDGRSGWLAQHPATNAEVWVSCDDGLWKITGLGTTNTATSMFGGVCAGVAFYVSGPTTWVLVVSAAQAGNTSSRLMGSSDGGVSWSDLGGDAFGSYMLRPKRLGVTGSGRAIVAATQQVGVFGPAVVTTAAPTIGITPATAPAGEPTVAYSQTWAAAGGRSPYAWTTTDALPPGLALAASTISGTPTAEGTWPVLLRATDADGYYGTLGVTIVITHVRVTTPALPDASVGTAYAFDLAAAGGIGAATWALDAGSGPWPSGVSVNAAGHISGTPAVGGTFPVRVKATDTAGASDVASFTLTVTGGVAVLTTALPTVTRGVLYSAPLEAIGGTAPFGWAVTTGALPSGLTLAGSIISGTTLAAAGVTTVGVTVTDLLGGTATGTVTITVAEPPAAPAAPPPSLVLAGQFELLAGGVVSDHPMCPGVIFRLGRDWDLGAPVPVTDLVEALALDGEQPRGERASNRACTVPITIFAPDGDTLAGAREALAQAVDAETWETTWTRPGGPPMILDCKRATSVVPEYSVIRDRLLIAVVTVQFPAAPYGRSAEQESVVFDAPSVGWPLPPDPVAIDQYTTVASTTQAGAWSQSSRYASAWPAKYSARWSRQDRSRPLYTHTLAAPVNITGQAKITFWLGLGTDQYHTWHRGRVVCDLTLTDSAGTTLRLSSTTRCEASGKPDAPSWNRVTCPLPGTTLFDFAHLTSYSVKLWNATDHDGGRVLQAEAYLSGMEAVPGAVVGPLVRGVVCSLRGVLGTARTLLSLRVQPGPAVATRVIERSTAGSGTWTPDASTTVAQLEAWAGGPGGGAGYPSSNYGGGAAGGAEYSCLPAQPVDAAHPVSYTAGAAGAAGTFPNGPGGAAGDSYFTIGGVEVLRAHAGQPGQGGNSTVTAYGGTGSSAPIHNDGGRGGPPGRVNNTPNGSGGGGSGGPFSPGRSGEAGDEHGGGSGGVAVEDGGPGGTGGNAGQPGKSPATPPGGGGGGGDDDAAGGAGVAGRVRITYASVAGQPLKALVIHRASKRAPHTLVPLVSFGAGSQAGVEYPVVSPVAGAAARFDGTYCMILGVKTWAQQAMSRLVTVTVHQYDSVGGRVTSASVSRTVTPQTDIPGAPGAGLLVVENMHLPVRALAGDQIAASYTVEVASGQADVFYDLLICDVEGSTIRVDSRGNGWGNLYVDAPTADRALGLVLGSPTDRDAASSVLDEAWVSGPPLSADPGDNWLLAYSPGGPPGLVLEYTPYWRLDRLR